ncbi:hypothetical protein [Pseudomonas sp.]|uniref:hypothetical protein n=1 Tax=Pseudomonas sp. TaxID=306 RepID=UPI002B5681F6|nr:hypothetical protein [Pseudomonas sp.]
MKLHNPNLLVVAALAVMTNGFTLLGLNHGSAGALARNLECNSNMARSIEVGESLKKLIGFPPRHDDPGLSGPFLLG